MTIFKRRVDSAKQEPVVRRSGFKVANRMNLIAGYRYLHINYDKESFLFDGTLAGPIFGASFRLGK